MNTFDRILFFLSVVLLFATFYILINYTDDKKDRLSIFVEKCMEHKGVAVQIRTDIIECLDIKIISLD